MKQKSYLLKWLLNRVRFVQRYYYTIREMLLYTSASQIPYKRVAKVKNEVAHALYYNFFGRFLFGIREVVALCSGGEVFQKQILLEGYDRCDLDDIYKEGHHDILWPKSPFVEIAPSSLEDTFIQKIASSYWHCYHDNPQNNTNNQEINPFTQNFQSYYFEKQTLSKEKMENFRADFTNMQEVDSQTKKRLNLSFILTDQLEVLSQSMGYFKSYLKSLDVVLDYHRYSDIIDHDILGSISESYAGNINTPIYRGQRLSDRILILATAMSEIRKHVIYHDNKRKVIVDIGGGFGHMGRLTHYYVPNSCYILVELDEMCCFGAYFLKYAFADKKVALYDDIKDNLDNFAQLVEAYDFIIMPTWAIDRIPRDFVDLYLAMSSVAELPKEYAESYLERIDETLKVGGYIYTNTRITVKEHTPNVYMHYKWSFKSEFLTLSYQHHPINRMEETSPQWIAQKVK